MDLRNIKTIDELLIHYAEMRGEYWIDDSGYAQYADGDIGDANHEGIALERLVREVLFTLGVEINDELRSLDLSDYADEIYAKLENDEDKADWEIDPETVVERIVKQRGMENVEDIFNVLHHKMDPRMFALKHWGWKRVKGNNIETWTLTNEDLQDILHGLDSTGELDTDEFGLEEFNIDVGSTQAFYKDVPLHVIEQGNLTLLQEYR